MVASLSTTSPCSAGNPAELFVGKPRIHLIPRSAGARFELRREAGMAWANEPAASG